MQPYRSSFSFSQLSSAASTLLIFLALTYPPAAFAVDGVIEINQAAAMAGAVTATDTPGLPVTLDTSGSYRLTGNLDIPDANTNGIEITAQNVTLDLNGFTLLGPTVCTAITWDTPVTECAPLGTGVGITSETDGITVRNGTVRGMGNDGLSLTGFQSRAERIQAISNGGDGLRVSGGPTVGGAVIDCTANANGYTGITLGGDGLVRGNNASKNLGTGIRVGSQSVVQGNNSSRNGDHGIFTDGGAAIIGNTVYKNASIGIFARWGATVIGNASRLNTGMGLFTQSDPTDSAVGYAKNVFTANNGGNANPQVDGPNLFEMDSNICGTNTTCP